MNAVEDKILERIRKVKNLADNAGTEGEAHAAICALQNLLAKYDVDLGEVLAEENNDPEQTVDTLVVDECGNMVHWRGWLGQVLSANFRCEVWWGGYRGHQKLIFMGLTNDVLCAQAAYISASQTMERMKEDYINQRRSPGIGLGTYAHGNRTSEGLNLAKGFRSGFITGLRDALRGNAERMALVLVKSPKVTEVMESMSFGSSRHSNAGTGSFAAYGEGRKAGSDYGHSTRANKLREGKQISR